MTKKISRKILSTVLAVAMVGAMSANVMASDGSVVQTAADQGEVSLRAFHRYYSTQINPSNYTEVMYDSNTWSDDMVTVYFESSTASSSVTYRLVEIMAGATDRVSYFTLNEGETHKVSIKAANNFRLAATGNNATITTYVTLATN